MRWARQEGSRSFAWAGGGTSDLRSELFLLPVSWIGPGRVSSARDGGGDPESVHVSGIQDLLSFEGKGL